MLINWSQIPPDISLWPAAILPGHVHIIIAVMTVAVLAYTAIVDARTGLVPPWPLLVTAVALLASFSITDKNHALLMAVQASIFYVAVWLVNEIHYRIQGHDALGLGDASWSAVATLAYGWEAVAWSWGIGAWLALLWLLLRRLLRRPAGQVYFVPFLFVALILVRVLAA